MSAPGTDVVVFPTIYSYVPVVSRAKKIVFIHDVIVETYPRLTVPRLTARLLWSMKTRLARRQADAIVTVSDHARLAILRRFKLDPDRLFVVGEAADPVFRVLEAPGPLPWLDALGVRRSHRIIAYVGGFGPHKNLRRLLDVFAHLAAQASFDNMRLVMVGDYQKDAFHTEFAVLRDRVESRGLTGRVLFTGYLPDPDVVALLNVATVLVLPSLLEGFGLPALEAAACGCPVIATMASPLPDVLGEGALYVDPEQSEQLRVALERVLTSAPLRQHMRTVALERAKTLTWDAAACELRDIIHRVAGS